jgi:hypothetical protein
MANLDCSQVALRQRQGCATAVFDSDYPRWRRDINADLVGDALTVMGRITNQEADGTLYVTGGTQRFNTRVDSLIQIAYSRNAGLAERRAEQMQFAAALQQVSATLLQAVPRPVQACNTMVVPNGLAATTTCTQQAEYESAAVQGRSVSGAPRFVQHWSGLCGCPGASSRTPGDERERFRGRCRRLRR